MQKQESFWSKNFSTFITAVVSITALPVTTYQVKRVSNLELALREQDSKTSVARFVMENRAVIISGTEDEKMLLRKVMERSFPEEICKPIFERFMRDAYSVMDANTWNPNTPTSLDRTASPKNKIIFLLYNDRRDASLLDSICDLLNQKGYQVKGKQLVTEKTQGDIKYFFDEDRDIANEIKKVVETRLSIDRIKISLTLTPLTGEFQNIPRGFFEVRLPSMNK